MMQDLRDPPEDMGAQDALVRPRGGHRDGNAGAEAAVAEDDLGLGELAVEVETGLLGEETEGGHEDCVAPDGGGLVDGEGVEVGGTEGRDGEWGGGILVSCVCWGWRIEREWGRGHQRC